MIYADNAATTKMSDAAVRTMTALLGEAWGNASSLYVHGQKAKEVLEKAAPSRGRSCSPPAEARRTTRRSAPRRSSAVRRGKCILSPPRSSTMPCCTRSSG